MAESGLPPMSNAWATRGDSQVAPQPNSMCFGGRVGTDAANVSLGLAGGHLERSDNSPCLILSSYNQGKKQVCASALWY